jgi:exosome complex RNA-binding protein Rrp42 (RNase PH superfamily)
VAFRRACITSCNVCDSPNCIRGALNSSRANYFDGLQIRIVGITIKVDTPIVFVASSEKSNLSHNSPAIGTAAQNHIVYIRKTTTMKIAYSPYHQQFL